MNEPEPLQQLERTYVRLQNRKLSYFSGCDYFRLSSHPSVLAAAAAGIKKYGLNVAASRMTTGNHVLYRQLERSLADFFGAEDALLVSSGYMTNLVVAQAMAGNVSHALLDKGSHPSLADAAQLLDCPMLEFDSRNPDQLASAVRRCGPGANLALLTDGMFSRDGSAAPLAAYRKVLPRDAVIIVDDAHGTGVLGRTGKGALEHAGVDRGRIIQTITLSKAFGAYGGAILSTARLRQRILDRSRLFVGSTPLPLPLANAALTSIKILTKDKSLRRRLFQNAGYVKTALRQAGLTMPETPGPILALRPTGDREAEQLKRKLLAAGIYPPFIRYPGGPASGYYRFVISSEHTRSQLDSLVRVLISAPAFFGPASAPH